MKLLTIHRTLGLLLLLFVTIHLANHFFLFWGIEAHLKIQSIIRLLYKNPLIEPILILAFLAQLLLGIRLLWKRGWPKSKRAKIQSLSGVLLAVFIFQHITAVIATRLLHPEIDTNIYWAVSVLKTLETAIYFAPYYFLGLLALFMHLAMFVFKKTRNTQATILICGCGALFAALIVIAMMGGFYQIELPPEYNLYIENIFS